MSDIVKFQTGDRNVRTLFYVLGRRSECSDSASGTDPAQLWQREGSAGSEQGVLLFAQRILSYL